MNLPVAKIAHRGPSAPVAVPEARPPEAPPVRSAGSAQTLARLFRSRNFARVRLLVDVLVLYVAAALAVLAAPVPAGHTGLLFAAGFPLVALVLLHAYRTPDERLHGSGADTVAHVVAVMSLAAMVTIAVDATFSGVRPVGLAVRLWLFGFCYVAVARVVLLRMRRRAVMNRTLAEPTLIVGAGVVGERLYRRLSGDPGFGLQPVAFLDADPLLGVSRTGSAIPVLGGPERLVEALRETGATRVILAFASDRDEELVEVVKECQRLGIEVSLVPRLYEAINERAALDHVCGLPLVTLRPTDPRGWQFAVKHAFDRSFALLGLVVLAPLMALIALAIKLGSPGPVLFRQLRVGRDGQVFDVLKFRTMREVGHSAPFVPAPGTAPGGVEGEDRRTIFGRWLRAASLDELPQLINVVRGEMSLVGPRPERPEFVQRFALEVSRYEDRHRVKSGITGLAQVNGLRGQTSIDDRVEWDNFYIQNWSLGLDLRILALTAVAVLRSSPGR